MLTVSQFDNGGWTISIKLSRFAHDVKPRTRGVYNGGKFAIEIMDAFVYLYITF